MLESTPVTQAPIKVLLDTTSKDLVVLEKAISELTAMLRPICKNSDLVLSPQVANNQSPIGTSSLAIHIQENILKINNLIGLVRTIIDTSEI